MIRHDVCFPFYVAQTSRDDPTSIDGYDSQTRSIRDVDDLAPGVDLFVKAEKGFPGAPNIGHPAEATIRKLADSIVCRTTSKSAIIFRPLPADDQQLRNPDIGWARSHLD